MRLEGITQGDATGWLCRDYFNSVNELRETGSGGELGINLNWSTYRTSATSSLANILDKQEYGFMEFLSTLASGTAPGGRLYAFGVSKFFTDPDIAHNRLESQLLTGLKVDPVEDGYTHPLEVLLEENIKYHGSWVRELIIEVLLGDCWNYSLKAGLIRLLSRLKPFTEEWRFKVVESGLSSPDVELRDAAVQAAENWEDSDIVQLLQEQAVIEGCSWLKDYISSVINDINR